MDSDGANRAIAARAIIHHHRLPQALAEWLGQQARQHISQAASGKGHHKAQRPIRPSLRPQLGADQDSGRRQHKAPPQRRAKHHVFPPAPVIRCLLGPRA